jgi:hypothetical protein
MCNLKLLKRVFSFFSSEAIAKLFYNLLFVLLLIDTKERVLLSNTIRNKIPYFHCGFSLNLSIELHAQVIQFLQMTDLIILVKRNHGNLHVRLCSVS